LTLSLNLSFGASSSSAVTGKSILGWQTLILKISLRVPTVNSAAPSRKLKVIANLETSAACPYQALARFGTLESKD
jgi:hypothetical protein